MKRLSGILVLWAILAPALSQAESFFFFPVEASNMTQLRKVGPWLPLLVVAHKPGGVQYVQMFDDGHNGVGGGVVCQITTPQIPDPDPSTGGTFICFAPTPTTSTPLDRDYRAITLYNDFSVEIATVTVKVNR